MSGTIGSINVPGIGRVPVKVRRWLTEHNADGSAVHHVSIGVDLPPRPDGGGEPVPLEVAS